MESIYQQILICPRPGDPTEEAETSAVLDTPERQVATAALGEWLNRLEAADLR
jgi:hypothetical protein